MPKTTAHTTNYPFGSTQPNPNNLNANQYRYGFGGMEKDKQSSSYTTYFRQYDPRIARWKSTDPVTQPWQSPYTAFDNNPILYVDPMGDVSWCGIGTVFSGLASFAGNMALRALPTLGLNIALNNFLPNATHTGNNSGRFLGADRNVGGGGDFTLESLRQNYVEGFKQSLTDKFGPLDFSSADALATSYFESIKDPLTFFSISNVQMLQDVTAILQNMPSYTANDYAYAAGYVSVDVLMAVVMKKYGGRVKAKGGTPRKVGNLSGGPLKNATQVRGRFKLEGGPKNGIIYRADSQGNITSYATYDGKGMIIKRVDVTGIPHNGVDTPHVIEYGRNKLPDGTVRVQSSGLGDPRPAYPSEIP